MNDLSLSVYVIFSIFLVYFAWFLYTFVNYKYNVLLENRCVFNVT